MITIELGDEERMDVRRAVREHIDVLRENVIKAVEAKEFRRATAHAEEIRRFEALYVKVKGQ